jgi:putative pyruvate formate lyase activating enzyme
MKYSDESQARKYSGSPNYPQVNQIAELQLHKQVGNLFLEEDQRALTGLLIHHTVLPNNVSGSKNIINFFSDRVSKTTHRNIMHQYRLTYHVSLNTHIIHWITSSEYLNAINFAKLPGKYRLALRNIK